MGLTQQQTPWLCSCASAVFSKARATANFAAGGLYQRGFLSASVEGGGKKSASWEGKAFCVLCGNFLLSGCEVG